jgi:hypothetical protein
MKLRPIARAEKQEAMQQSSSHFSVRTARSAGVALLLAASAQACSEASPPYTPTANGGGGQLAAGAAGASAVAGAGNVPNGGAPPATSGAAGMAGAATGGAAGAGGGAAGGSGGPNSGGAAGSAGSGTGGGADDGWVSLFNGMNLEGWIPSPGAAALFAVSQLENEGVIHVYPTQADQSQQPQASLRTKDSFSSYVYHAEYKWGTKRFSDRKQSARDNGICFHICNDPAQVWPESIEFQLGSQAWPGDWVSGNIFMLVDKTRAKWPFAMMNNQEVFSATGTKKTIGAPMSYYKALAPSNLNKDDGWNIVELTVHGSTDAEYKVNGTVVNGVSDMECNEGGAWKPLDHGPIALQAEFAEVYFRNVKIKVLP